MNIMNMIVVITLIQWIIPYINRNCYNKENLLSKIGDHSFGIYFIHILVLNFVRMLLKLVFKDVLVIVILSAIITLGICYFIVRLCSKYLPDKINKLFGF